MKRASLPCPVAFRRPSCVPGLCTRFRLDKARFAPVFVTGNSTRLYHNLGIGINGRFCLSGIARRYYANSVIQGIAEATLEPTIYALSTAPGRAAIAVIRISGSACTTIYRSLCPSAKPLKPRTAAVRGLFEPGVDPSPETLLDSSALLLYFPAPRTVTGEDILELHVHGGIAVVKAVLAAIPKCTSAPGSIRYAEPGEFTRRAFMNDRLDLTQVEALGDTLSASTEQQRRLSVRGTTNQLAQRYESWRQQLLYARGELEALIDFSEDQHFDESPRELTTSVAAQVSALLVLLEAHSRNVVRGELLRNGIGISLLGAPNAGKSSLLNRIVGREAAIVSQEAGTTRDVVEVGIDLGGYLCRLGDTAGLRRVLDQAKTEREHMQQEIGQIEKEGMRRAKERAAESDIVLVVLSLEIENGKVMLNLDAEVMETAAKLSAEHDNVLVILNKIDRFADAAFDLASAKKQISTALPRLRSDQVFFISCREAETSPDAKAGNISNFLAGLISKFEAMTSPLSANASVDIDPSIWQESLGATERHRLLLEECQNHLLQFLIEVGGVNSSDEIDTKMDDSDIDIVLAAESLRSAGDCLARITGKGLAGDTESVLGVVFEKFCVGK